MVLYTATIRTRLSNRPDSQPWSNVYHINAASKPSALLSAENVGNAYINALKDYAEIYNITVQQDSPLASAPAVSNNVVTGLHAGDINLMLPLFNTIRVTFVDGVGRPNLKYFRFPLQEDEIEAGVPTTAFLDDIQTVFLSLLPLVSGFVSNRGVAFTDISAVPLTQMRQQGWHRRTRPGYHRGWVPD